jgi:hypothetical protein
VCVLLCEHAATHTHTHTDILIILIQHNEIRAPGITQTYNLYKMMLCVCVCLCLCEHHIADGSLASENIIFLKILSLQDNDDYGVDDDDDSGINLKREK